MAYKTRIKIPKIASESDIRTVFDQLCNFLGNDKYDYICTQDSDDTQRYTIKIYIEKGNLNNYIEGFGHTKYNKIAIYTDNNRAHYLDGNEGYILSVIKSAKGTAFFIGSTPNADSVEGSKYWLFCGESEGGIVSYLSPSSEETRANERYTSTLIFNRSASIGDIILTPRWSFFGGGFKEIYSVAATTFTSPSYVVHNNNGYFLVATRENIAFAIPIDYIPD